MDRALVCAHGKMVAMVASVLQASGVTTTDEFARLLKVFADTVGEADPEQAEILALWSETVRHDAAAARKALARSPPGPQFRPTVTADWWGKLSTRE